MKYLPLVWASLWRKKARTVFTLLSIASAFLLFGLLQGINAWFGGLLTSAQADRLYVLSRVSQLELLPIAHLARIERLPGIRRATYIGALPGVYQEPGNDVIVLATDPVALFDIYSEWQVSAEQLQALAHTRTGAIVGAPLMKAFGWKVGDRLPLRTSVVKEDGSADWTFEIVGVYDVKDSASLANRILANYAYFDAARRFDQGRVYAFVVDIDDPAQSSQMAAAIDALFANSADATLTQNERDFAQGQLRQIGDVGSMINAIVGAVLFALLFLTANTMMQSVRERVPELAVLKTIGYPDGLVTALVLAESLVLCLAAALAGLGAAAAVFPLTEALGIGGGALPSTVVATALAIAALLALVSGIPPARRAHRLTIVDALAGR